MSGFLRAYSGSLLVEALVVADELEEERDVVGPALVADALDPRMLLVVDVLRIVGRVVEQDFDAVGADFLQATNGPLVEEVREPPGPCLVVAGLLVREQKAGVLRPAFARGKPPLRVEQDRARVRRQHFRDDRLEVFHLAVADGAAAFLGERLLKRSPLIHGGGGNHAARVRNGLHAGQFSRCEHGVSSRSFRAT